MAHARDKMASTVLYVPCSFDSGQVHSGPPGGFAFRGFRFRGFGLHFGASGFGVSGVRFQDWGGGHRCAGPNGVRTLKSRIRNQGAGCSVQCSVFRVQGAGIRVQGSGFRVEG